VLEKIDAWLFGLFNALAGRSWALDTLIDLPLTNNLVKAAVIGACFLFAWHQTADEAATRRRREILLIAVAASIMTLGITQPLGHRIFHPRPFVAAQEHYRWDGAALVQPPALAFREPLAGDTHRDLAKLRAGQVSENDLGSFPSDHAGFFFTLALGIWLACRRAGWVAIGWTLVIILMPRIVMGQHWPLDIAAGAAIGGAVLAALYFGLHRRPRSVHDPVVDWTMRHSPFATALIFLFLAAAVNALADIRDGMGVAKELAKYWIGA
jgi:membrane-associated phospholipid phosphatase